MNNLNGEPLKGDGYTEIAIGDRDGKVIMQFPAAISWCALDPQNAFQIGEAIARAAHTAKFGTTPNDDGSYIAQQVRARITEDLRDRMVIRSVHIMRNLKERGKSLDYVARELVDTIFAEVDR